LNYLIQQNINATFFIKGNSIAGREVILQKMATNGFDLGVHTWTHPSLLALTDQQIRDEISQCIQAIKTITGVTPKYFRPPYLDYDGRVHDIVVSFNLITTMVSLDTFDWKYITDTSVSLGLFQTGLSSGTGAISLMHDTLQHTVQTIPDYMTLIKNNNYTTVLLNSCQMTIL
jgi:peptidoglycan/xylan/chitin deacetylase (PgdA/CDA1 family)